MSESNNLQLPSKPSDVEKVPENGQNAILSHPKVEKNKYGQKITYTNTGQILRHKKHKNQSGFLLTISEYEEIANRLDDCTK